MRPPLPALVLSALVLGLLAPAEAHTMRLPPVPGLPVVQLSYVAGGTVPFTVFLSPPNGGLVETRWVFPSAGAIEEATFDAQTRHLGEGAYSFLWINDADLDRGWANLGHDIAVLTSVEPAGYIFTGQQGVYVYSHVEGYLLQAVGLAGGTITLAQAGLSPILPTGTTQDGQIQYSMSVIDPDLWWPSDPIELPPLNIQDLYLVLAPDGAANAQNAYCTGIVRNVFGGTDDCSSNFPITKGPRIVNAEVGFPALSTGVITGRLEDETDSAYWLMECTAKNPKTDLTAVTAADCANGAKPDAPPRAAGMHTIHGDAVFEYCLDPRNFFTCPWQVYATYEDEA